MSSPDVTDEDANQLGGKGDAAAPAVTTFVSTGDLASALRRAEAAHAEHEQRIGSADPNWSDWYAAYMVAEQTGAQLPA